MYLYFRIAVCLLLMLNFFGCNKVEVIDSPISRMPAEVAEIVTHKYPDATNLLSTPLIAQKVWEVGFRRQNERHLSMVTRTEELSHMRFVEQAVPDSLAKLLVGLGFGEDMLTNFRQEMHPSLPHSLQYAADYSWSGSQFTVYWTFDQLGLREKHVMITPRTRVRLYSDKFSELPEHVQDFIKPVYIPNGTATAVYAGAGGPETFVVGDAPSHFALSAYMIVNNDGQMLYSKMGKLDNIETDDLPEVIKIYLRDKVGRSLTSSGGIWQAFKFEDRGIGGYKLILRQPPGYPVAEAYLYFDLKGKLLWQHFYGMAQ